MAARLLLIRHGETVLGAQNRYAGRLDTPLTANGRKQVLDLRPVFDQHSIDRIYSSDLERCRETTRLLAPDREVVYSASLRELAFGKWEGRTCEEINREQGELYRRWMCDPLQVSPPDGESLVELSRRVTRFVGEIARDAPSSTIALITHGGPIRVLLEPDLSRAWSVAVPYASLIVHEWTNGCKEAS